MRIFVIPRSLLLLGVVAATYSASADVIHLKNGDVIYADQVKDRANNVEYEIGDNTFSIPKSKVQSVETGARPAAASPSVQMPAFTPETPAGDYGDLLNQIVRGHEVDRSVLSAIESRGKSDDSAIAYYIAARAEFEAGKFPDSRRDLETALHYSPQSPAILNYYAAVLVRTGNALDAISYAERAAAIAPDSADAWAVLGYAQFSASRNQDAVLSWKKSLVLRFDPSVQKMIERAERETSTESSYSERETGHFVLHYEGRQSSEAFREQLLSTLESAYQDLAHEFGAEQRLTIQVVLYTNQAFFDVTRAPAWMGALNDGKLRIPLQGLDSVTPELARVLRHELTHSFVNSVTLGRCPEWLNEGIAQMLEPQSLGSRAADLAQLYQGEHEIPLNSLEHGYASFNGVEARLAYDEALASAEYIRNHYGMSDMLQVLQHLGQGDSVESSLRAVLHTDYAHLEDEIRGYVVGQSGN
ncbi:MAG TPA: tetratricopeptide repeat protein [Terriglobales bacterium]